MADWSGAGPPRSRRHGDVYFSAEDGLAESRAVFLQGCGLPQAWAGRPRFCVGELGLGTGRNLCALLDLWRRTGEPQARLHIFAIEEDLLSAGEARRALSAWPELGEVADQILARWPRRARGVRRIDLPGLRAVIDVAMMEAEPALRGWTGRADAWFLDGFSPALDPRAWRADVMALVAARSAPGARAASYTVAGHVRQALAGAGFIVERRPGHGAKRERLEARLPGATAAAAPAPRVAIIGAGIAGASLARALGAQGVEPLAFETGSPGACASRPPAALAAARLDAGLGPAAQLFAQAAARAQDLYDHTPGVVLGRGVVQLPVGARDGERFAKIVGADLFEAGALRLLSASEASARLGEPAPKALLLAEAPAVDPAAILSAWLGAPRQTGVAAIERQADGWGLLDAAGATLAQADAVCLAAGPACATFAPGLPTRAVRGQTSLAHGVHAAGAASFAGQVIDTPAGVVFGATHDRDDFDPRPRRADDERNLSTVAKVLPSLARRLSAAAISGWAGVRSASLDYLPLAGPLADADSLFVFTGLGARGFTLAPLLGEHVAALILGLPSPLPAPLAELVDPARFARRAARGALK